MTGRDNILLIIKLELNTIKICFKISEKEVAQNVKKKGGGGARKKHHYTRMKSG